MLFRVRGPTGATVYLLGSVHLLARGRQAPAEVDSAFAHAKTVAFETSLDTVQMRAQELMTRGQYTGGATLRSTLSPAGLAKADSVLKLYGLTVDQVNGFKPWFVSVAHDADGRCRRRSSRRSTASTCSSTRARSRRTSRSIGLESVDFQLGLFDRISPADQERMLTMSTRPDSRRERSTQIKDAWVVGDATMLDSLLNRAGGRIAGDAFRSWSTTATRAGSRRSKSCSRARTTRSSSSAPRTSSASRAWSSCSGQGIHDRADVATRLVVRARGV